MENLEKGLNEQLNRNGFSFQYSVLKVMKQLFDESSSPWNFVVSEFPVMVNEKSIHIDFVFVNKHEPFYLVGECKRANPATSNWCFVKAPYVSRKINRKERIVREVLRSNNDRGAPPTSEIQWYERSEQIYRLPFEIKTNQKGEGNSGRGQINEAVTQVLRGYNGLFEFFQSRIRSGQVSPWDFPYDKWTSIAFIPVIFTTAKLFVSEVDLSDADLLSGNINQSSAMLFEKKWLLFNYSQTPDLVHDSYGKTISIDMADVLYSDYTRTIPIVNSSGISDFLTSSMWKEPSDWQYDK